MDGNPEGTPNPLNPVQSVANPATGPEPSTDAATGTGTLDYIETEVASPTETVETTEVVENVNGEQTAMTADSFATVRPASFAQTAQEIQKAQDSQVAQPEPEPAQPAPTTQLNQPTPQKPVHTNYSMADPMMRPVSKATPAAMGTITPTSAPAASTPVTPTRSESNFNTFAMKEASDSQVNQNINQITEQNNLVAKDSIVEPAGKGKNKKHWLVIGAITLVIIAIICGATAIAIAVLTNNEDRVTKAVDKLLTGQAPSIIGVNGKITGATKMNDGVETLLPVSNPSVEIKFDGTFDLKSSMNKVEAEAKVSYSDDKDNQISIKVNELTNKDGNTFFKISGVSDLFNRLTSASYTDTSSTDDDDDDMYSGDYATDCSSSDETDCITSTNTSTNILGAYGSGLFDAVEDEWILISGDFAEAMSEATVFDNTSTCLINAFGTLPEYAKDIANKYKANPFITYSTDNLKISKRKNNLYKLGFDSAKLSAFVNSLSNNGFINELNACTGSMATNTDTDSTSLDQTFSEFPDVYVEIDENYNFTRVYFDATANVNGVSSTTTNADINIIYPTELKITDPTDYVDMSTLLYGAMTNVLLNSSTLDLDVSE